MNSVELGKLLKLTRQQKGLTQEQLAETLSVTTSAISKWENGKNLPDTDMLLKIALTLNLSIEDLYYPEQTIGRLSNTVSQNPKETISYDLTESDCKTTNKGLPRHLKLIVIASCIVVFFTIIGVLGYIFQKNHDLSITPVAFRTTVDTYYGTVYEVGCTYTGDLDNTTQLNLFLDSMGIAWKSDTFISSEIIYKKVSFYHTVEDARAWTTPIQSFYLVR